MLSDKEIVKLYQFGSILSVDNTIMQIRRRVPGYQRGTRTGHNRGLSFVELFEHPKIAQQLLDIFIFSRNCLKEHFRKSDNIISPIMKLGLSKPPLSVDTLMRKNSPKLMDWTLTNKPYTFEEVAQVARAYHHAFELNRDKFEGLLLAILLADGLIDLPDECSHYLADHPFLSNWLPKWVLPALQYSLEVLEYSIP